MKDLETKLIYAFFILMTCGIAECFFILLLEIKLAMILITVWTVGAIGFWIALDYMKGQKDEDL